MTEFEEMIARINELAHASKARELTEEEKKEQAVLRRKYIDNVKANLKATLKNVEIVEKDGSITKLDIKD